MDISFVECISETDAYTAVNMISSHTDDELVEAAKVEPAIAEYISFDRLSQLSDYALVMICNSIATYLGSTAVVSFLTSFDDGTTDTTQLERLKSLDITSIMLEYMTGEVQTASTSEASEEE